MPEGFSFQGRMKYQREDLQFLESVFTEGSIQKLLTLLESTYALEPDERQMALMKLKLRAVIRFEEERRKKAGKKRERDNYDRGVRAWYRLDNDEKYVVLTDKKCMLLTPYQALLLLDEREIVYIDRGYTEVNTPQWHQRDRFLDIDVYHPGNRTLTSCICQFNEDGSGYVFYRTCFYDLLSDIMYGDESLL